MENNHTCIRLYADSVQIEHCRKSLQANRDTIALLSSVLALAGNEVRLQILFLLHEEHELCPCDLADILGMSVPAVSQHLRKMKDKQLIQARRSGQTIFYSLNHEQTVILEPILKHIHTSHHVKS